MAEIKIYVYFDDLGSIHAISPEGNDEFAQTKKFILLPLSEVEIFLTGKANLLDYSVIDGAVGGEPKYKLIKKTYQINYVRNLDSYLSKIPNTNEHNAAVLILNDLSKRLLTLNISKDFKEMYTNGNEEQQALVSRFLSNGVTSLYITKRNDPYSLFFSVNFSPNNLFNTETLKFRYELPCVNTSAYTKKSAGGFVYRERI